MNGFKQTGVNVTIWPKAHVVLRDSISLGSNIIIDDFAFVVGGGEGITLGDYVHIASFVSITGGGRLEMGDFSGLAAGARIVTGNEDWSTGNYLTNPTVPAPYRMAERSFVKIGKHAMIGTNAIVFPGVTIGEGALIGAGTIMRHDAEPWTVYYGTNGRALKKRPHETILQLEKELRSRQVMVSVCCLTYNHAGLIRKALDGFLMQKTKFEYEVLVHDDASTDGTADILREYESRYRGIVKLLLQDENQFSQTGIYPVTNCYRAARGKYIAECDGDDYWTDPHKLQKQVDFLEANTDYALCHHDYLIDEHGKMRLPHADPPRDFSSIDLIRLSPQGYGIGFCTRMWRNIYSEATAEDFEVMAGDYPTNVYLGTIGKGKYLPGVEPSVYRRNNGSNSWCSLPSEELASRTKMMNQNIYAFFKKKGNRAWIDMRKEFLHG